MPCMCRLILSVVYQFKSYSVEAHYGLVKIRLDPSQIASVISLQGNSGQCLEQHIKNV